MAILQAQELKSKILNLICIHSSFSKPLPQAIRCKSQQNGSLEFNFPSFTRTVCSTTSQTVSAVTSWSGCGLNISNIFRVSLGRILIPEADFHPGDLGPQFEEGSLRKGRIYNYLFLKNKQNSNKQKQRPSSKFNITKKNLILNIYNHQKTAYNLRKFYLHT